MHAIIIDDHPLAIAAIRNLLIKNDIGILAELSEGGSAVQRVETLKPDSGIIIIVSAKNDHFYGKHCADAGANGFVSKKEGMNNIIAAIEAAKNGYCYFPFSLNRFVGSLTSDQQKLDSLSKQEISVMRYILDGKDNNDIAEKMFISNKTVSTYKSRLMEKLECKSLMDLYTFAQRNKIG
ncbi:acid-sensing system DNA-binding response regulator EvgA [Salmonella enterica]|uniref:acid-sensing system DNA-binding response regulator EvgA n=1 Tax=Salmonella enterica TaxID=28901 RepID=UPI000D0EE64A|nr:acid-sensing system DNA-binding response regulator EvgA [Salmonella enterica]